METLTVADQRLSAEIEALRAQYPETPDLYREVCLLLFFRHGITPTTNKLYQLVRKGSMSAPAEALNRFWETLREKSRIRIEHPDLPQPLRDAAGELVSALWQQAQAAAREGLSTLRSEAQAEVIGARTEAQAAHGVATAAQEALTSVQQELQARDQQLRDVQAELARAQGEASALQRQVDTGAEQRRELQEALKATQQRFTAELEQQRAAAATGQQQYAADLRRALLEVDRERSAALKLHKELEQARRTLADQADAHRHQIAERQHQIEDLRQRNGELEGTVTELRRQLDRSQQDLEDLRLRAAQPAPPKPVRTRKTMRPASSSPKPAR